MEQGGRHLINGEPTDVVSVMDRGLRYGDGCFETMAVRGGRIPLWDRHYRRLTQSCARLKIGLDFSREHIERELASLATDIDRAVMRLTITRGNGGAGYACSAQQAPTRIVSLLPERRQPAELITRGVAVRLCETRLGRNPALAGIKHLNRLEQVLARAEWGDEYAEGLLCNDLGHVIEGTITNVFIVNNDQVYTPQLNDCGVAGVMRAELIARMRDLGIDTNETVIDRQRLMTADECFLTNAIIGIWPVTDIDGNRFTVGNTTRRLVGEIGDLADAGT